MGRPHHDQRRRCDARLCPTAARCRGVAPSDSRRSGGKRGAGLALQHDHLRAVRNQTERGGHIPAHGNRLLGTGRHLFKLRYKHCHGQRQHRHGQGCGIGNHHGRATWKSSLRRRHTGPADPVCRQDNQHHRSFCTDPPPDIQQWCHGDPDATVSQQRAAGHPIGSFGTGFHQRKYALPHGGRDGGAGGRSTRGRQLLSGGPDNHVLRGRKGPEQHLLRQPDGAELFERSHHECVGLGGKRRNAHLQQFLHECPD